MSKFEYSDFYKFIASIGITLIIFAVLVPWLFLREPFDLLQKQEEITLLTPLAQSIILNRQITVQLILRFIPTFSIVAFLFGFGALGIGGVMWFQKTQRLLDRLNELSVRVLEKRLGVSSPEEVKTHREEEIAAQLDYESPNQEEGYVDTDRSSARAKITKLADDASKIQSWLTRLLVSCFANTYSVLPERRLGPVILDIVMAARNRSKTDYIIEFKYIQSGFKFNWLRDNAQRVVYANQVYQQESSRTSIPILFVVGASVRSLPSLDKRKTYISRIEKELTRLESRVIISMISKVDLENIDCRQLVSLLEL